MVRLRADYVFGTTTAALAAGDTTLSGAALARLPVVASPNVAALTLYDDTAGVYEIVWVTAHTAAATTATVLRGREGSTAQAWPTGSKWSHGATRQDFDTAAVPAYSADFPPVTPNARDDEFDGTSSATWTTLPGTALVHDVNTTKLGHLYISANAGGTQYVGRYQATPTAYPFTVTTKVAPNASRANFQKAGGILLLPASPVGASGTTFYGPQYNNGPQVGRWSGTVSGTYADQAFAGWSLGVPVYVRAKFNSATSVDFSYSPDGLVWITHLTGHNPGFSIANVGLGLNEEGPGPNVATFDWFRVS